MQDDAFLADVNQARRERDRLRVWWLGQSGFLIQWNDHHLLLDPYLSDSLTKKYAQTDKPHVRLTERVIAPERLDFIEAVTSSHQHTDHLDPETLGPLLQVNPELELVIPEANRALVAERLGIDPRRPQGLNAGESLGLGPFEISAVPAAHNQLEVDAAGHHRYLGYVIEVGRWTLYHSGDTKLYPGMEDNLRQWKIDLAFLPINGDRPERRVSGNLDGREAVTLARSIDAQWVIPCHYDLFAFNTVSTDEFVAAAVAQQQAYQILKNGAGWSVP